MPTRASDRGIRAVAWANISAVAPCEEDALGDAGEREDGAPDPEPFSNEVTATARAPARNVRPGTDIRRVHGRPRKRLHKYRLCQSMRPVLGEGGDVLNREYGLELHCIG
jgi:hypothetical protein